MYHSNTNPKKSSDFYLKTVLIKNMLLTFGQKTKGKLITRQHVLLNLNVFYNLNTRWLFNWTAEDSSRNSAVFHTVIPSILHWPKTP